MKTKYISQSVYFWVIYQQPNEQFSGLPPKRKTIKIPIYRAHLAGLPMYLSHRHFTTKVARFACFKAWHGWLGRRLSIPQPQAVPASNSCILASSRMRGQWYHNEIDHSYVPSVFPPFLFQASNSVGAIGSYVPFNVLLSSVMCRTWLSIFRQYRMPKTLKELWTLPWIKPWK